MAKDFSKAGLNKNIEKVKKISAEKAQLPIIRIIDNENLVDNPYNKEDISFTDDLVESIKTIGFIDSIDVTDFNMEDGKYMILSGHRRRAAGVKAGVASFPCVIRHFDSEDYMKDFLLLANNYRNTDQDPLLMCKRFQSWKARLTEQGVKNYTSEAAKKLGLSDSQASRYDAFGRIIPEVQDLVARNICGMSAVVKMAQLSEQEQGEIYNILVDASDKGNNHLSRETVNSIIKGYTEDGKNTWAEIADLPRDSGLPLSHDGIIGGRGGFLPSQNFGNGDDGWRKEKEDDYDISDDVPFDDSTDEDSKEDDNALDDLGDVIASKAKQEEEADNPELKNGSAIEKHLKGIEKILDNGTFDFANDDTETDSVEKFVSVTIALLDEYRQYFKRNGRESAFYDEILSQFSDEIESYNKARH